MNEASKEDGARNREVVGTSGPSKFWVSWYHVTSHGEFELHAPWWMSGESALGQTLCAAIRAVDEDDAMEQVISSYDARPFKVTFRFIETRPDDWSPFNTRFLRADWMKWDDGAST